MAFDTVTGEPAAWAAAEPVTVTWYQHAVAHAEMKWPRLALHSRASLADALATVTPLLTWETSDTPPDRMLRAALYRYAFNPQQRRSGAPDPVTVSALAWLECASLPVSQLSDPHVIRAALDGLCIRLDGSPAAALLTVYSHCIHGHEDLLNQQIGQVLEPSAGRGPCPSVESQRLHRPRDGRGRRPLCVRGFPSRPADGPWTTPTPNGHTPKQQHWPQSFVLIKANIRTRYEQRPAA